MLDVNGHHGGRNAQKPSPKGDKHTKPLRDSHSDDLLIIVRRAGLACYSHVCLRLPQATSAIKSVPARNP